MDSFNRCSSKGASLASVYILETGLVHNAPRASLSTSLCMLSSCRKLVLGVVSYTIHPQYSLKRTMVQYSTVVCLCPVPTSSVPPLGWDWEPPCTGSLTHWCVSWRRGVNATTAQGIWLIPQKCQTCVTDPDCGGLLALFRGAVNAQLYNLWAKKPETTPCCPFLYGIYCLLWYQGSAIENRSPDHQQRVPWRCPWQ